jgi:hypothetical protein
MNLKREADYGQLHSVETRKHPVVQTSPSDLMNIQHQPTGTSGTLKSISGEQQWRSLAAAVASVKRV